MSEYAYLYATLGYIDISTAGGKEFFKQKLLDAFPHPANLTTPIIVLSGDFRYNVVVNARPVGQYISTEGGLPSPGLTIDEADSFLREKNPHALQYNFGYNPPDSFLVAAAGWTGYLLTAPHLPLHNPFVAVLIPSGNILFVREGLPLYNPVWFWFEWHE